MERKTLATITGISLATLMLDVKLNRAISCSKIKVDKARAHLSVLESTARVRKQTMETELNKNVKKEKQNQIIAISLCNENYLCSKDRWFIKQPFKCKAAYEKLIEEPTCENRLQCLRPPAQKTEINPKY